MMDLARCSLIEITIDEPNGKCTDAFSADARRLLSGILSSTFVIPLRQLMSNERVPHGAARVRNIAIYVLHVQLGLSFAFLGRVFGRNRSTVRMACQSVEDLRDDHGTDFMIECLSRALWDWVDLVQTQQSQRS